jgi:hypothetical protein
VAAFDCRNEPMDKGSEADNSFWRHVSEVQQVPPRLDDDRSGAGRLQRGVLDEVALIFEDGATRAGPSRSANPVFRPSC